MAELTAAGMQAAGAEEIRHLFISGHPFDIQPEIVRGVARDLLIVV